MPRYIAEPPQESLPYGRWADALAERFLEAARGMDGDGEHGDPGEVIWFPERTYGGRTYIPATAATIVVLQAMAAAVSRRSSP